MEMDTRRLVLQASLRKLLDQVNVQENVFLCLENMSSLFAEADEVAHQVRRSNTSDWSRQALVNVNLERIGEFRIMVTTVSRLRTVFFFLGDRVLKFLFKPQPRTLVEQTESVVGLMKSPDPAEREKVLNAFKKSVLRNGRPVEENLLGKKLMALDDYRLVRVEILYRRPIILELILGARREVIYKSF